MTRVIPESAMTRGDIPDKKASGMTRVSDDSRHFEQGHSGMTRVASLWNDVCKVSRHSFFGFLHR